MSDMLKATPRFPLAVGDPPLFADDLANTWDIRLAHDRNGYGLAFRFDANGTRMQVLLSDDDAERLSLSMLSAVGYVRARNHLRDEMN